MPDTLTLPAGAELAERLTRMARLVVMADAQPSDAGAAFAIAMWEIITGVEDAEQAVAHARRIAAGAR